ncbi:MAG: hypothetical protein IIY04_02680 [Oscillospiraceae bacterium]|nr:hypothetical protein [Oscillospiraceae bacterium]
MMQMKRLRYVRSVYPDKIKPVTLEYHLLAEKVGVQTHYGISIRLICTEYVEEKSIRRITTSRSRIERMLLAMAQGTVTPVTMRDVVDDML